VRNQGSDHGQKQRAREVQEVEGRGTTRIIIGDMERSKLMIISKRREREMCTGGDREKVGSVVLTKLTGERDPKFSSLNVKTDGPHQKKRGKKDYPREEQREISKPGRKKSLLTRKSASAGFASKRRKFAREEGVLSGRALRKRKKENGTGHPSKHLPGRRFLKRPVLDYEGRSRTAQKLGKSMPLPHRLPISGD